MSLERSIMGNPDRQSKIARMLQEVDLYLDEHADRTTGRYLWEAFGHDSKSQVRGLQQTVYSTTRFYDIIAFIKNQMGKEGKTPQWNRAIPDAENRRMGDILIEGFETLLREGERIAREIGAGDEPDLGPFPIALRLARGWVRQITAEYLYQQVLKEGEAR
ncbi:MAG: hypothetical protein D6795_06850 [Deltaproteobacteria bacterium]|nr:MAG: hypothetical protein D6795_06850 [Deltaproteobacteria bacterium]